MLILQTIPNYIGQEIDVYKKDLIRRLKIWKNKLNSI